jgi:predicted O-linked N-acetylglucosamine transferase (SPINDLY family)
MLVCSDWVGGSTSTYELLAQGTPVVTYPSQQLAGRFSAALVRRVGLGELVASTLEDLPALAIKVA